MIDTTTYPLTARVWVYMADRKLNDGEVRDLHDRAQAFTTEWAAHGKDLNACAEIRHNQFLILMVDEERNMASGCSIDSSVHFVQEAGKSLQVDFFNRMLLAYRNKNGEVLTTRLSDLGSLIKNGEVDPSTRVFNNLIEDRKSLDTEWEVPLSESPYQRWL